MKRAFYSIACVRCADRYATRLCSNYFFGKEYSSVPLHVVSCIVLVKTDGIIFSKW